MTRGTANAMDPQPEPARDTPFQGRDDLELGEWMRTELVDFFGLDEDPWAVELVGGITARLNAVRTPAPPLEPVILWAADVTAFIGPGRYLYVTRGLLHRAWWEDAVALAVAHEMAHHDLGHTRIFARLGGARLLPGSVGALLLLIAAERWLSGPEYEAAADAQALELCLRAGFDGKRCVELFDVLTAHALDHGDVDGVFGPTSDREESTPTTGWRERAEQWLWRRSRGYPPLQERKEALLAYIAARNPSSPSRSARPSSAVSGPYASMR